MSSHTLPDLLSAKRILCVQPHYDDNDIFAGGAIAALHDLGAEITYLTVTDDLVGVLDQSLTDAQMTARLRAEQKEAGTIIGVDGHCWLGYPDAGSYDYYHLRMDILRNIRSLRPDFVLTVDPWLPYEVHQDHILTGRAASEAVLLAGFTRLETGAESDQKFDPLDIRGIVYYCSAWPNTAVDISQTVKRKHAALRAYRAQFSPDNLDRLVQEADAAEREAAQGSDFSHAEPFKVLRPDQLHGNPRAWQS